MPDLKSWQEFQASLLEAIYAASPDAILVVDERDIVVSHNDLLFDIFGIAPEEIPGSRDGSLAGRPDQPLLARVLDRVADPEDFLKRVKELYANPQLEDHCEIPLKDGRTLERHSRALWNAERHYLGRVWFFRDITAHKRTQRELLELSQSDPLTGVANRRCFFQRANEEFERARRFGRALSLVMLDIDHFKRVNDRWGHAAGDRVLRALCENCAQLLRKVDLLARVGGEEFAVLLPDTDLEGAWQLAERLRVGAAGRAVPEEGESIRFTVSAGVATLLPSDTLLEEVLRRADRALYEAKGAGRNRTQKS
jgi:diguanylate cyclase (GGDEF)-like protein/PAS domain S-box-containing protein